jgi:SAM-dependent methyltransferase
MAERLTCDGDDWGYSADHLARYLLAGSFAKGKRVLDAGTGPGYGAFILKQSGASHVQGVDFHEETLVAARKSFGCNEIEFLADDCHELKNVTGPFDLICSFENIEHLKSPLLFLQAAARVLSPQGILLCSTPDRAGTPAFVNGRPANEFHFHEWYENEFKAMLVQSFDEIEMRSQVRSNALVLRTQAVAALQDHLEYLWGNPMRRGARWLSGMLGRKQEWPSITGLRAANIEDYPIVDAAVASLIGKPWCHFAICGRPKKQA